MGNQASSSSSTTKNDDDDTNHDTNTNNNKPRGFPGSAVLEKIVCGNIDTTHPDEYQHMPMMNKIMKRTEHVCGVMDDDNTSDNDSQQPNDDNTNNLPNTPTGNLLARALVHEVQDTVPSAVLQQREVQLLKSQAQAASNKNKNNRIIGGPEPPQLLQSVVFGCTGETNVCDTTGHSFLDSPHKKNNNDNTPSLYRISIGLSLSRVSPPHGHPATITRQQSYDLNQLQDRDHKYVASTSGWLAGGGVKDTHDRMGSPDVCCLKILDVDCPNMESMDAIVELLASGDIFIPHVSILPDQVCIVNTTDLCLTFGCEYSGGGTDQHYAPIETTPNWSLEFLHNQLYQVLLPYGARWTPRPFSLTLAHHVKWKTIQHMNQYFRHAESVLQSWRQNGPQYMKGDSQNNDSPESTHPHGIYLFRNGMPTNYFRPNFEPPYSSKLTRSLLNTVIGKSWNAKSREWYNTVPPNIVPPSDIVWNALGCGAPSNVGYVPHAVTTQVSEEKKDESLEAAAAKKNPKQRHSKRSSSGGASKQQQQRVAATDHRPALRKDDDESDDGNTNNDDKYVRPDEEEEEENAVRDYTKPIRSPSSKYTMSPKNHNASQQQPPPLKSTSLEYSTDGSSALAYDSSLIGPDFSNHTLQVKSSSDSSIVPTDQELYRAGWAKALDSNSGHYYYFTLDRRKTVWENPLDDGQHEA